MLYYNDGEFLVNWTINASWKVYDNIIDNYQLDEPENQDEDIYWLQYNFLEDNKIEKL